MVQGVARGGGDGGGLRWANKQRPVQTKMFSLSIGVPAFQFKSVEVADRASNHQRSLNDAWVNIIALLHSGERNKKNRL